MLVYFAVILTTLVGICGLAIDTGRVELRTLQLQSAADAGALAAAGEMQHEPWNWQQAANTDIAAIETANGLSTNGTNAVQIDATAGPYAGDYSTLQVTITQPVHTIFMGLLSSANATVNVTATAVAQMPPCFVFMGTPTINNGFNDGVNTYALKTASAGMDSNINYWGCPVYAKPGFEIDGFAHMNGMQVSSSGPASASNLSGSDWVAPVFNALPVSDPLAYVTAPTAGGCANSSPMNFTNASSMPLSPGTYCGATSNGSTTPAVTITGAYSGGKCTSTPTLTMSPGLYVIVGGFSLSCVNLTGSGVTIYLTKNASVGFGTANISNSTVNVNAPVDASGGAVPGIVLMTDRNWSGGNKDIDLLFSNWTGDGVIYSPATGIYTWQTNMSATNYLNIVAANMYLYNGQVHPSANYGALPGGSPLHAAVRLVQ